MPDYRGHYYDLRPRRPGWSWTAFDRDRITLIGRGDEDTKSAADTAATRCIESHGGVQNRDD